MRRQIVVVSGGASSEHDVSVASGAEVSSALAENARYSVIDVHVDREGAWHVAEIAAPPQCFADVLDEVPPGTIVFPVLHGGWGEGGGLQRELETRGIRFVGSGATASARALSKLETLRLCAQAGVRVVPTWCIDRARYWADPDLVAGSVRRSFEGDLVVKPDTGGSSIGVRMVPRGRSPHGAIAEALADAQVALIQPMVVGHEVSIGVWADDDGTPRATGASLLHLPPGAADGGFTYAHKYEGAGAILEIPAALSVDTLAGLRRAAMQCFTALGCRALARVDFFVDRAGRILLNEINTIPGLRRESHFPRLVAAAGTPYPRLLENLVEDAVRRPPRPASAHRQPSRNSPEAQHSRQEAGALSGRLNRT